MSGLGSDRHRALIGGILEFYKSDPRVRAVAVFGSVTAGTWHELSDVDLDVVIEDGAVVVPAAEVEALFEARAAHWSAAAAVERMRASLVSLRGRRDTLKLDTGNVEDALARVLAETRASFDLGSTRSALLDRICTPPAAGRRGR